MERRGIAAAGCRSVNADRQTDRQTGRQAAETTVSQEDHKTTVYTHYPLILDQ